MVAVLLACLLSGGPKDAYGDAYRKAQKDDVPLVVYVTAKWCPACQRMRREVIDKLDSTKCSICVIDYDDDPEFARKFIRQNSIPQTTVYWLKESRSKSYVGYHVLRF